jgi:hypothetical protein
MAIQKKKQIIISKMTTIEATSSLLNSSFFPKRVILLSLQVATKAYYQFEGAA